MFSISRRFFSVSSISSSSSLSSLLSSSSSLVVIDFYASWCPPCKAIAPVLEKASETYKNVEFVKVDVDALPDLAMAHKIQAMPTFQLFKNNKMIKEIVGADSAQLLSAISTHSK
eukprot:comp19228_c0_seq1/m.36002 comp19228_c0_seq1/g.36002  ORF comp19228_c0_seq1/g.36002 comp19228_c0_seq1/m.36002 type:complete len:115 (+) comp19228_c0_seq1:64-408(+)